ncbi:tail fiber assembly protein [Cupriavidus sp. D384]
MRDDRLAMAALRIASLEDAASLAVGTDEEMAALLEWRRCWVS